MFGVRRRRGAWLVALVLLGYALLTGGRPPAMRAAVMVCAACLGLVLRRPVLAANSFALAWLVVAAVNPTDLFTAGCQLPSWRSPSSTGARAAGSPPGLDPLERLVKENRPIWQRAATLDWPGDCHQLRHHPGDLAGGGPAGRGPLSPGFACRHAARAAAHLAHFDRPGRRIPAPDRVRPVRAAGADLRRGDRRLPLRLRMVG